MFNFENDIRNMVMEQLDMYKIPYQKNKELYHLLIKLFTFLERYVSTRKRKVLVSNELKEKLNDFPDQVQEAVEKMRDWIEKGVDINAYQSRGLYGQGSPDYQNMIYGIVHLHLSAKKEDQFPVLKKNGFAKASKYLLYAYFTDNYAYFLDIDMHPQKADSLIKGWTDKRLFRILVNNWSELLQLPKLEGCTFCDQDGKCCDIDDDAIYKLASNNISTFISIGNDLYMPNLGYTCDGKNMGAVFAAQDVIRALKIAEEIKEKNPNMIIDIFQQILRKNNKQAPKEFDIHLDLLVDRKRIVFFDRISGAWWDYMEQGRLEYGFAEKCRMDLGER